MRRKWVGLSIIAVSIGILFFVQMRLKNSGLLPLTQTTSQESYSNHLVSVKQEKLLPLAQKTPLVMPPLAKVRAEVSQNPHRTPPSMVVFAHNVGVRLKLALHNEAAATALFSELEACATGQGHESIDSVAAFCILQARLLSKKFSSLKARLDSIESRASSEARRIERILRS